MSPIPTHTLLSVLAWVCVACAAPTPVATSQPVVVSDAPPAPIAVGRGHWLPGEQMFWDVSMHGLVGIKAVLVVGQPGQVDDRPVIIVRSRVTTSGLAKLVTHYVEEATTMIDVERATPIWRHGLEQKDDRKTTVKTTFHNGEAEHTRTRDDDTPYTWQQSIPPDRPIYDNQSILGLLRAWDPQRAEASGQRRYFYAVTDELLHRHIVHYAGHETLRTKLGVNEAIRYDISVESAPPSSWTTPHSEPGRDTFETHGRSDQSYTIWISDDVARRPLLLAVPHRYGRVNMELTDYWRPRRVATIGTSRGKPATVRDHD